MAHKRGSERGVMQVASGLMLAAFGAMFALAGCSSTPEEGENLGSVSQAVVCNGVTCGTGANDCNTYTCAALGGACVVGKPIKNPGDACLAPGKLVNPPGRCAADTDGKFVCCTGCLDQPTRGEYVCRTVADQDVKNCGAGGVDCAVCQGSNCGEPSSCEKGACVDTPVADDTPCADKSGVCYKGECCAGCIDANGACQPGNLATVCGVSIAGDKHATCQTCIDSDICTTDICKEGTCVHGKTADNTPCADGNNCDGAETCQGGVCKEPAGFTCPSDGNACHAPTCNGGTTCGQQLLTGTNCPDANLCNGTETCNNGVCNGVGTPKNCDDKNPCTTDGCDPKTGNCINTPVTPGELCENGDVCDGIGVCAAGGVCQVQPAEACVANRPNDPCNVYACDKVKGCVVSSFTTAVCNDSDPCTVGDKCDGAGKCVSGTPQKCDDGNPCTADSCTKGVGCVSVAANENDACDDGNVCSTGDKCVAGKCKSSGGKTCPDDTNPCTVASCDAGTEVCGQTNVDIKCQVDKCHEITQCANGVCPTGTPIDCADTNPCTKDACDPATGCTHVADDTATCTDTDVCTESTSCKAGKCVAVAMVCEPVSDCHLAGTCNPNSGFCDAPRAPAGKDCNDNTGKCDDKGKCIPKPAGEGGAGGEGGAPGTSGTGGSATTDGGEPPVVGNGGEGNQGTPAGGDTGTTPNGGKAGNSTGGTDNEGGAPETPRHVFVRDPGGCSCSVPASQSSNLAWLGGLALVGTAGVLARRRRARLDAAARNSRVS